MVLALDRFVLLGSPALSVLIVGATVLFLLKRAGEEIAHRTEEYEKKVERARMKLVLYIMMTVTNIVLGYALYMMLSVAAPVSTGAIGERVSLAGALFFGVPALLSGVGTALLTFTQHGLI